MVSDFEFALSLLVSVAAIGTGGLWFLVWLVRELVNTPSVKREYQVLFEVETSMGRRNRRHGY